MSFFLGFGGPWPPPPPGISNARRKCIPPAPRVCLRQNARTAQRRRRPEGRFSRSPADGSSIGNIDFNRPLQAGAKFALLRLIFLSQSALTLRSCGVLSKDLNGSFDEAPRFYAQTCACRHRKKTGSFPACLYRGILLDRVFLRRQFSCAIYSVSSNGI